jgi:hypothetical protein
LYSGDFVVHHCETCQRKDVAEVFNRIAVEFAFLSFHIKLVFAESVENFFDVFPMFFRHVGIEADVINVDKDTNVEEVGKDVVHETLKGCGSIRQTERHNNPFKRTVACAESGFPLVAFTDSD